MAVGLDWWWYAEVFVEGRWRVWPDRSAQPDWHLPALLWVPGHRAAMDVFVGPQAVIGLSQDLPGRPPESEFLDFAERYARQGERPMLWCDYSELLIDEWATSSVLVTGRVSAWQAPLFTDGTSAFPERALRDAGLPVQEIKRLRDGHLTDVAIDRTWGRPRHEVESAAAEHAVDVTWTDSVAGLLGHHVVDALQAVTSAAGQGHRLFLHYG